MVLKKRSVAARSARVSKQQFLIARDRQIKSALAMPSEKELSAGASRITEAAKTSNIARDLYEAIVLDVVDLLENRQSRDVGLTASEADFLLESGEFTQDELKEAADFITSGGLERMEHHTHLRAIADTYTSAEAASLLKMDASSLRPRQGKSKLYSFMAGRNRLYPKWQFIPSDEKVMLVPNLVDVVPAIPKDWGPADVEGFMTTPQDDLRPSDEAVEPDEWLTPIEWLAALKDPAAVVSILEEDEFA
ncbi:hypothetical protein [Microbacterium sp.]|uniref:hypothetical protein n=1 Tax=Microbacterium sp. TaxID=51671 RepID=UPI002611DD54|nr:hypothetical protein [Microbacterium sp.]MCV0336376.1 hypothetical protein [Microbacterium sp.]MCV0376686.1 hypothetical protein [Microbacterium sp.]MCV0391435.1 hypothetical protein [Microbacterium sp.]MCV0420041.1 hypothetical protein [Microbacterium sp.]MCV0423788.1 hypothetical protein [Microbacterium sp.]